MWICIACVIILRYGKCCCCCCCWSAVGSLFSMRFSYCECNRAMWKMKALRAVCFDYSITHICQVREYFQFHFRSQIPISIHVGLGRIRHFVCYCHRIPTARLRTLHTFVICNAYLHCAAKWQLWPSFTSHYFVIWIDHLFINSVHLE